MTVIVTNPISGPFTPNGVTVSFPFGFKVASPDEVTVTLGLGSGETVVSAALYSVTLAVDGEGGSVIFAVPPASGSDGLYIRSEPSFAQETKYSGEGNFNPRALNLPFDRGAIRDIWLREQVGRTIRVPMGEAGLMLPPAAQRTGYYFVFDGSGGVALASGTGNDAALRVDIAQSTGAAMVGADDGAGGGLWSSVAGFIAYLRRAVGSSIIGFLPDGVTRSLRTIQDKLRETQTLADFGAIGDGQLHTVSEWIIPGPYACYPDLAAVQADYPHVTSALDCLNWAAIQKAHDWAIASWRRRVTGQGRFKFMTTVALHSYGITLEGPRGGRAVGSAPVDLTFVWGGGNEPMFTSTTTRHRFANFLVVNEGSAKSWLEMNAGAQGISLDQVHCQTAGNTSFTEAFVKSNGNRMGDSVARDCLIGSVASKLFYIDGQSTPNSITGIRFEGEGVFTAETQNCTVLHIKGETYERVIMRDQRFLQKSGYQCLAVDTSDTPSGVAINSLVMDMCEFEADAGGDASGVRFGKLHNIQSIRFNGNKIDGGGAKTYGFDLVNSHVTECEGNFYNSIGTALFDADATSTVHHGKQAFSQRPVFITASAGIYRPTYGASIQLDGRRLSPQKTEIIEIRITDANTWTLSVDTSAPEWMSIGQVIILRVMNLTGGAVYKGGVGAGLNFHGGDFADAPAAGTHRDYIMSWDGDKLHESVRAPADLAN